MPVFYFPDFSSFFFSDFEALSVLSGLNFSALSLVITIIAFTSLCVCQSVKVNVGFKLLTCIIGLNYAQLRSVRIFNFKKRGIVRIKFGKVFNTYLCLDGCGGRCKRKCYEITFSPIIGNGIGTRKFLYSAFKLVPYEFNIITLYVSKCYTPKIVG